jgi:hypothetical protein
MAHSRHATHTWLRPACLPTASQRTEPTSRIAAATLSRAGPDARRLPWPRPFRPAQVRDKLVSACQARGVQFLYDASVEAIEPLAQLQSTAAGGEDSSSRGSPQAEPATAAAGDEGAHARHGSETAGGDAPASSTSAADEAPAGRSRRCKRGRGLSRAEVAEAGGGGGGPLAEDGRPRTRWLCRLRDGREHVSDRLVRGAGLARACVVAKSAPRA